MLEKKEKSKLNIVLDFPGRHWKLVEPTIVGTNARTWYRIFFFLCVCVCLFFGFFWLFVFFSLFSLSFVFRFILDSLTETPVFFTQIGLPQETSESADRNRTVLKPLTGQPRSQGFFPQKMRGALLPFFKGKSPGNEVALQSGLMPHPWD